MVPNRAAMHAPTDRPPNDIARVDHWETVWKETSAVHDVSTFNYYDFRLSQLFRDLIEPGSRVVEIGCGGSRWIGYFARALQCETWGIDYSPEGLKLTGKDNPGDSRVHLVEGNFFDESLLPSAYFDLIYSLGFIEHFTESAMVTRRMAQIVRPGGKVMTLVPNFTSLYGAIQKRVNRSTHEKHVIMNCAMLEEAHLAAGLTAFMPAKFFGSFGPGVVDYGALQRLFIPPIKLTQHLFCWMLHFVGLDGESRVASPYIVGVYQKPDRSPVTP